MRNKVEAGFSRPVTRRRFAAMAGGAFGAFVFGGACHGSQSREGTDGRLTVRPRTDSKTTASGTHRLGLSPTRDAILQVPKSATSAKLPLCVLLHGAGGSGSGILRRLGAFADESGIVVLAPDSRDESSWDAISGDLGPDVVFLNRALQKVFETVAVDPDRISVGGFSDGASYALTLGLINGDLFPRIVAYSPGFIVQRVRHGQPKIFVSHGRGDDILPIDRCSRRIVPALQRAGYDVTFREFDGGHTVPADIAREGMTFAAR
jgi:predicted esterase